MLLKNISPQLIIIIINKYLLSKKNPPSQLTKNFLKIFVQICKNKISIMVANGWN